MNRKFLSCSNCVLEKVLNKKENIDIVQDFINTVLKIETKEIQIIEKINKQNIFKSKKGIIEVLVTTKKDKKYLIGIQIIDGFYIQNKIVLYHAQLRNNQELYDGVLKTITINILDDNYYKTNNFDQIIKVKEQSEDTGENLGEIHLLELPKFKKNLNYTKEEDWITYLRGENLCPKTEKVQKLDIELDKYWEKEEL